MLKDPWSDDPNNRPKPADHRAIKHEQGNHRHFVIGVDDWAQQRVAGQMEARAKKVHPDYVLNVGDNFYWAGVDTQCGQELQWHAQTWQWKRIFQDVYSSPNLKPLQWLGVLGNHDYGGWSFTGGWDQTVGYSWHDPSKRWVQPALYWKAKVWYTDFSVDLYFVDTNVFTAHDSPRDVWSKEKQGQDDTNICSKVHNADGASCWAGPSSVDDCPGWFHRLWEEQALWMMEHMEDSIADWQVVVTHLPPNYGQAEWMWLSRRYGIDLIVSGHVHLMQVVGPESPDNFLAPTAWVISGGGGGITSQGSPDMDGQDDQYGFVDLTLSAGEITIESVSHGGVLRSTSWVRPRAGDYVPAPENPWPFAFTTTTTTFPLAPLPEGLDVQAGSEADLAGFHGFQRFV